MDSSTGPRIRQAVSGGLASTTRFFFLTGSREAVGLNTGLVPVETQIPSCRCGRTICRVSRRVGGLEPGPSHARSGNLTMYTMVPVWRLRCAPTFRRRQGCWSGRWQSCQLRLNLLGERRKIALHGVEHDLVFDAIVAVDDTGCEVPRQGPPRARAHAGRVLPPTPARRPRPESPVGVRRRIGPARCRRTPPHRRCPGRTASPVARRAARHADASAVGWAYTMRRVADTAARR